MGETEGKKEEADYKRLQTFPLVRHSDMPEEMRVETMELCVTACEKFSNNNESAAKMIKETMDKKFGSSWHVVIGEGFGFEITHEVKNLLYLYFGGTLAVLGHTNFSSHLHQISGMAESWGHSVEQVLKMLLSSGEDHLTDEEWGPVITGQSRIGVDSYDPRAQLKTAQVAAAS
ncbi:dynein light chain 4, axonemal [Sigmodon hispidus]